MDNNLLEKAIKLIKSGDVDSGQSILLRLLQHDAANEAAWLWLSKTYSDNRVQYCMEKILEINPHNEIAQAFMRKQEIINQELEQKKYQEKIRIENLSKKYLREDGILVFKPSRLKVFLRLIPIIIPFSIFGIVMLSQVHTIFDAFLIFTAVVLFVGGILSKQTASGFDVELSETTLSGPMSIRKPLFRRTIPMNVKDPIFRHTISIKDIDLEKTKTYSNMLSLSFFASSSYDEKIILLSHFDIETLQDLSDIIYFRQMN